MSAASEDEMDADATIKKRRRGRNWALLFALMGFVALIYLITVVKVGGAISDRPL